jgi:hypothetical protein
LVSALPAGSVVKRGDTIAELRNTKVELELARLEGEHRLRQLQVEHLERLRGVDREANDQLPAARAALADSERRVADVRRETERLTLKSPVDGVVIAAPRNPAPNTSPAGASGSVQLATWSGSLLEDVNSGAYVTPGTLVCLVGDPAQLTAVMFVDDTDVKRLQRGQKARLRLDQLPGQVIHGEVVDVARHDARDAERAASGPADLDQLYAGVVPPEQTGALYQARVQFGGTRGEEQGASNVRSDNFTSILDPHSSPLIIGGRGEAKVAAERVTVARLIWRYFAQTFRLPM